MKILSARFLQGKKTSVLNNSEENHIDVAPGFFTQVAL